MHCLQAVDGGCEGIEHVRVICDHRIHLVAAAI
jgi:hypothetical protein